MEEAAVQPAHVHAPPEGFISKYVFSLDHKMIGKQYYGLALVSVFMGMVLSVAHALSSCLARCESARARRASASGAPGGLITPEYYLSLLTMHGTLMVFFVLTNAPFAGFGNYFLPIQIGAEDMAFPRFNMMSFWTTFVGFWSWFWLFFYPMVLRLPVGPPTRR